MQEEQKSKGGRIAKKDSIYFSQPGQRSSDWRLVKHEFGSIGIDILLCAFERICRADFYLLTIDKVFLKKILLEDQISEEDFTKVITYCVHELELFDWHLFGQGKLFSIQFVRNFEQAGLFRNRKYGVKAVLKAANYFRTGCTPITLEDELEMIANGNFLENDYPIDEPPTDIDPSEPSDDTELPF